MVRRPPRSTQGRSSAASDVDKRQSVHLERTVSRSGRRRASSGQHVAVDQEADDNGFDGIGSGDPPDAIPRGAEHCQTGAIGVSVPYTHLRAHETVLDLVCRLLLAKKQEIPLTSPTHSHNHFNSSHGVISRYFSPSLLPLLR